jgi:hypothetical protein
MLFVLRIDLFRFFFGLKSYIYIISFVSKLCIANMDGHLYVLFSKFHQSFELLVDRHLDN